MPNHIKIVILLIASVTQNVFGWGFQGHKLINQHAIFLVPDNSLFIFLKTHSEQIVEYAVNADKRRYAVETEACKHYIDFESYQKDTSTSLPKYYKEAVAQYSEDSLQKHGTLPWTIAKVHYQLSEAMLQRDIQRIIRLAADLGHYVGDAHVPLHTTRNYDGQYTNQRGIHALWETRLPELFASKYDFVIGKAQFVSDVQAYAWQAVHGSHAALDSVLSFEKAVSQSFPQDRKYGFEERGAVTVKVYSPLFAEQYSLALDNQPERQIRKAIKMLADLWYTAWIEAGQPDLTQSSKQPSAPDPSPEEENKKISNERFLESHHFCVQDGHFHFTHSLTPKP